MDLLEVQQYLLQVVTVLFQLLTQLHQRVVVMEGVETLLNILVILVVQAVAAVTLLVDLEISHLFLHHKELQEVTRMVAAVVQLFLVHKARPIQVEELEAQVEELKLIQVVLLEQMVQVQLLL